MLYIITGIYMIVISLAAVIITVSDKLRAVNHQRRIPERTLLTVALGGGACFMYMTMLLIRHKTRHHTFMQALPLMIMLHLFLLYGIYYAGH